MTLKGQRDLAKKTSQNLCQRGDETKVTKRKGLQSGKRQQMGNGHIQEERTREGSEQGGGDSGRSRPPRVLRSRIRE